jgi:hypothetical protein
VRSRAINSRSGCYRPRSRRSSPKSRSRLPAGCRWGRQRTRRRRCPRPWCRGRAVARERVEGVAVDRHLRRAVGPRRRPEGSAHDTGAGRRRRVGHQGGPHRRALPVARARAVRVGLEHVERVPLRVDEHLTEDALADLDRRCRAVRGLAAAGVAPAPGPAGAVRAGGEHQREQRTAEHDERPRPLHRHLSSMKPSLVYGRNGCAVSVRPTAGRRRTRGARRDRMRSSRRPRP